MKIRDLFESDKITIKDIPEGTVFEYAEKYFMKIEEIPIDSCSGDFCNAVRLNDGTTYSFNEELINVVDCELVVTRLKGF